MPVPWDAASIRGLTAVRERAHRKLGPVYARSKAIVTGGWLLVRLSRPPYRAVTPDRPDTSACPRSPVRRIETVNESTHDEGRLGIPTSALVGLLMVAPQAGSAQGESP